MDQREEYRPPHPAPNPANSVNVWLVAVLLVLVAVLLWRFTTAGTLFALHDPNAESRVVAARGDLAADELATIELFKNASPSVVHVTTLAFARDRFTLNLLEIPRGSGSGFIWDSNGYVVTNYHVLAGATAGIRVLLSDNSSYPARLVGVDPDNDIAVLKIDAPPSKLKPLPIGTSSDLQEGQKVFAIGNPFGLDQTLTTGVISGLGREIQSVNDTTIQDVIQTDAAINPGNSGGPLLDSAGRLIGINTAIYSPSGAYAGVGFAVPVDAVNRSVPQLIRTGRVEKPGLGILVWTDAVVERLVERGLLERKGVLVRHVGEDSTAAKAGLNPTQFTEDGRVSLGDLIVAIDGEPVENTNDLYQIFSKRKVGDTVTLTVVHNGTERAVQATLQALSASPQ